MLLIRARFCRRRSAARNPCCGLRSKRASTAIAGQRAAPVPHVQTGREKCNHTAPSASPRPVPRQTLGDGAWKNARDPWRCGNRSGCPGSPSTAAATGDSAPHGVWGLPAGPAERRSDQHWKRTEPRFGSSPDKTVTSMPAPAALCLTFSRPWVEVVLDQGNGPTHLLQRQPVSRVPELRAQPRLRRG